MYSDNDFLNRDFLEDRNQQNKMFNLDEMMGNIFGNNIAPNASNENYPFTTSSMDGMPSINNMNNMNLTSPSEGYMRGNLFANLYEPYKNYKPAKISATNEKEKLFNEMSENAFAAHEINLYLDLHPDDKSMLQLFNDYRKRTNQLKEKYENMYGPLSTSSNVLLNTPFLWSTMDFPWKGGM